MCPRRSTVLAARAFRVVASASMILAAPVARAAERLGIPEEKSVLLQHLILSHHGEPEYGAAVRPVCAESELLSQIDMLDSRMEIYRETLAGLQVGEVSSRIFALDKRVFKPHELNG